MFRRVALLAVFPLVLILTGCGLNIFGGEQRAAWRDQEERACMRARAVMPTAFLQPVSKINGKGACGIAMPLKVSAFADGSISVGPIATLGCPMTAALESWMQQTVQPAALAWFGAPVVEIKQISNYSCRPINNIHGEPLSEHAFGNALDISAFTFADGRSITVLKDWNGREQARGFLREIYTGGCRHFKTALGPGARFHEDHFHFDLAHRGRSGTEQYCNPKPDSLPVYRAPYRGDVMAAYPGDPVPLLADAPPDVRRELYDPFGVAESQERRFDDPPPMPRPGPRPPLEIPMSYFELP
jgi:hypothetical protein